MVVVVVVIVKGEKEGADSFDLFVVFEFMYHSFALTNLSLFPSFSHSLLSPFLMW